MDGVWRDVTPSVASQSPPIGRTFDLIYDQSRRRVVLFGRNFSNTANQTWEWVGTFWSNRTPASSPNTDNSSTIGLVYDTLRERTRLFEGSILNGSTGIWEWDGQNWSDVSMSGLIQYPQASTGVVYDEARNNTLLFGGRNPLGSSSRTWQLGQNQWSLLDLEVFPSARNAHAMVYDSDRQSIFLFGGSGFGFKSADTWEWNSTWLDISPAFGGPAARSGHSMAYDNRRKKIVMYGGTDLDGIQLPNTWELDAPDKPSMQFGFMLPTDIQKQDVDTVKVRAFCGGHTEDKVLPDGAELFGWITGGAGESAGRFKLLASK